jgi:hypothetical protein
MRLIIAIAAVCLSLASFASAQAQGLTQCVIGGTYTDGSGHIMYCTGNATATQVTTTAELNTAISGVSGGMPAGLIALSLTACPSGWGEVAALNGVMVRGTVAANANVGTTGGSDTRTPAGTVSQPVLTMNSYTPVGAASWPVSVPTFSGAALATHAHELPFQISSATVIRQIAAATFGTGTSRAATATQTHTANTTSAAVALSQAVSAGTPAGTIAWPASVPTFSGQAATLTGAVSAPTFTGQALDNRPAYVNAIFCAKQ